MQALLAPLTELAEYGRFKGLLKEKPCCLGLTGCVDSQKLHMIYELSDGFQIKVIATYSDVKAKFLRNTNFMTEMSCCIRQRI